MLLVQLSNVSFIDKSMSLRTLEYLFPVPRQKFRLRQVLIALRQDQAGTLVGEHPRCRFIAAVEMLAENDLVSVW